MRPELSCIQHTVRVSLARRIGCGSLPRSRVDAVPPESHVSWCNSHVAKVAVVETANVFRIPVVHVMVRLPVAWSTPGLMMVVMVRVGATKEDKAAGTAWLRAEANPSQAKTRNQTPTSKISKSFHEVTKGTLLRESGVARNARC